MKSVSIICATFRGVQLAGGQKEGKPDALFGEAEPCCLSGDSFAEFCKQSRCCYLVVCQTFASNELAVTVTVA